MIATIVFGNLPPSAAVFGAALHTPCVDLLASENAEGPLSILTV